MEKPFPNTPEDRKKFFTFIYLAMILALITGVEIVLIWMPIPRWVLFWSLGILSLVKFLGVIWWFMHMRWDRALIAILFFLGVMIGGGTAAVLWALFVWDPHEPDWEREPLAAREVPALVERV
jgi:cytochrome c oxidase subunit IV